MEQCMYCRNRIFLKPLPDEGFTFCWAYDDGAMNINLKTGVSSSIEKHGLNNITCWKFSPGISMSVYSPYIKEEGEQFLKTFFKKED